MPAAGSVSPDRRTSLEIGRVDIYFCVSKEPGGLLDKIKSQGVHGVRFLTGKPSGNNLPVVGVYEKRSGLLAVYRDERTLVPSLEHEASLQMI